MRTCPACRLELPEISRFCTNCGRRLMNGNAVVSGVQPCSADAPEQLNLNVLYGMVAALALALLFPPWETPPGQPPEFLGFHFLLFPPSLEAIVSRMLLTIELVTLAIAGLYGSFLFRKR